ncbi:MAG: Gfo/Idh/MocA family oxidoreductase [Clostridia bacterium]|nr:Gfo/Idh/MocA family oxidoreductase [Clostridia bacterium]
MIKIGIFGVRRGADMIRDFLKCDCEIAAICERRPECAEYAINEIGLKGVKIYEDFDEFIKHDMDAVVLSNFFHEHTPYAIKCFERGLHVYSECISNSTMAEGVELVRAFEKYGKKSIYMLAENYPMMKFNREMRRVVEGGTLGKILYAEGEYNHPGKPYNIEGRKEYSYFERHWRNYLPRTYYITHSLGPVMYVTGAVPKRVTAFTVFAPPEASDFGNAKRDGDKVSQILTQNDDGSTFRITGAAAYGARHDSYRVCGTAGQIENLRGMDGKVMLRYSPWTTPEGKNTVNLYAPYFEDMDNELARTSGHGGGDYIIVKHFVDCIKKNRQPDMPFDIYSATTMASVAILAHRSVLNGNIPYDIPDFRLEEDRTAYENDDATPFYYSDGRVPNIRSSSNPDYELSDSDLENYRKSLES